MVRRLDGLKKMTWEDAVPLSNPKCGRDIVNFAIRKAIVALINYELSFEPVKDRCTPNAFKYLVSIAVSRGIY